MALTQPAPGLRIRHNANSAKRVEIIVPALDELEVSPEVAAQLQAADPHFEPVGDKPATAEPAPSKPSAKKAARPRAKAAGKAG